jgi:hypothetical protein
VSIIKSFLLLFYKKEVLVLHLTWPFVSVAGAVVDCASLFHPTVFGGDGGVG